MRKDSICAPTIAPLRSRAIVSVSGSSGTARQLSPADVAPELLAAELHLLRGGPTLLRRGRDILGHGRHREHSTARRNERPVVAPLRARVKDVNSVDRSRQVDDV